MSLVLCCCCNPLYIDIKKSPADHFCGGNGNLDHSSSMLKVRQLVDTVDPMSMHYMNQTHSTSSDLTSIYPVLTST
ncbi:hypothetical protein C5167_007453 [Papaver somniferum]|nr:hypothetical protein C5167_007453 [Papaver somniferum]